MKTDHTNEADLMSRLTPMQYEVTQREGTEPAFNNDYWDEHRDGIYVDLVSGEALFSSRDKYDSGTGWPSFYAPLEAAAVEEHRDWSMIIPRTEIRCAKCGGHLGHVFPDGPEPTGQRYCMNSCALKLDKSAG